MNILLSRSRITASYFRTTTFKQIARMASQPTNPPAKASGLKHPSFKIYNSLSAKKDKKDVFEPIDPEGKKVKWYTCGPTVYDDAHLGHARNYVSTDIVRRIMKDYFHYEVQYVENITDIDDKIILRSRQQYLLQKFRTEHPQVDEIVLSTTKDAFKYYIQKNLKDLPSGTDANAFGAEVAKTYERVLEGKGHQEGVDTPGDDEAKLKMHVATSQKAVEALQNENTDAALFYSSAEDVLLPYLDSLHGSTIENDHGISLQLTQKYEARFFEDMRALNVLDPDNIVRVTEYVPQIVKFVEKIISKGFAYSTDDGSVYFDINSFKTDGYTYPRLNAGKKDDKDAAADGEGALASKTTVKRSDADFVLWKASKPGEPWWPSPWGEGRGRPGWHIECSVMASEVLGEKLDLHSGGIDLRFPHHDNELAQSEAFWGRKDPWVNYFIHMGHLSIQGSKMSKSLKNFQTIRDALRRGDWDPRSLRIAFLLGAWASGVEITDGVLRNTAAWEDKLDNFFLKALDVERTSVSAKSNGILESSSDHGSVTLEKAQQDLWGVPAESNSTAESSNDSVLNALQKAKRDLYEAFCDSFDTPQAMKVISDLVTEFNSAKAVPAETVLSTARWVTQIVTILGLDIKGDPKDTQRVGWSGVDIPTAAQPFIFPVSQIRDQVRQASRGGSIDYAAVAQITENINSSETASDEASKPYEQVLTQFKTDVKKLADEKAPAKDLLTLCDQLRDTHLWNLGIYLEDREEPLGAIVRPVDKSLKAAREEQEQRAAAKAAAKAKSQAVEAEKKRLLEEKAKISHLEMFKTAEYSAWDENGIPTKDTKGEEVGKGKKKKLQKEWEKQKKLHEDWSREQGA